MPTFKLDGKEISFTQGETIIQAAWKAGVEIPHYCWHPGLSIAANCRMCLVQVKSGRQMQMPIMKWDEGKQEYVPSTKAKLFPACQMPASPDMEVESEISEEVADARKHVQEFLLLNHPVDCPICDQAGECKLQDYWLEHQGELKRMDDEPVHKPKAERFGPTIVYDAERCILCTRCIRVCDEVVGDHVLDMRERGNKNEIVVSPGRELDHDYTLMTEHVCPVGALTSKDFRFKARVWFLRSHESVCSGCATGCNSWIDADPRSNEAQRMRPRENQDVNQFWMCDDGMMTYTRIKEDRVELASLGRGESAHTLHLDDALREAAEALAGIDPDRVAVVLSAEHSTEDNFVLAQMARGQLGSDHLYLAARGPWRGDDILRHEDANPNRAGAQQAAGRELGSLGELAAAAKAGKIHAVLALGSPSAEDAAALSSLGSLKAVVVLASHRSPLGAHATVQLPVSCWAENHGSFVNAKGLSQRFRPAVKAAEGILPAWQVLVRLAALMDLPLEFGTVADVRAALPAELQPPAIPKTTAPQPVTTGAES